MTVEMVGTSLPLSKISVLWSSDTLEHVSVRNSYKIFSSFITLLRKAMITSHKKLLRVYESAFALLVSCGAKNVGSKVVFVFVIWDLKIFPQAVSKLEAISEPDQLQMHLKDVVYENVELSDPLTKCGVAIVSLYITQSVNCNTLNSHVWTWLIANWNSSDPCFWWLNLKERDYLEDLGIGGMIILKWILQNRMGGRGLDLFGSG